MMLRSVVKAVLLAEAFAVATFALGWWSVPIVAVLYAAASKRRYPARFAGLCAAGGWGALLLLDFAKGPVANMGTRLGGVMGVPPAVLFVLTLLFPALLAWCAATFVPQLRANRATAENPA
ncbi:MAG TPA: hypothetical protein VGC52_09810 [Gemmatimonadaceae bacterium]